eukprot:15350265-Ditylum_brightwellii.AAC.1
MGFTGSGVGGDIPCNSLIGCGTIVHGTLGDAAGCPLGLVLGAGVIVGTVAGSICCDVGIGTLGGGAGDTVTDGACDLFGMRCC